MARLLTIVRSLPGVTILEPFSHTRIGSPIPFCPLLACVQVRQVCDKGSHEDSSKVGLANIIFPFPNRLLLLQNSFYKLVSCQVGVSNTQWIILRYSSGRCRFESKIKELDEMSIISVPNSLDCKDFILEIKSLIIIPDATLRRSTTFGELIFQFTTL